jgi:hypothetical protein
MSDLTGDSDNDNKYQAKPALGLRWPIKRSFVNYVRAMADGVGSATQGASVTDSMDVIYENDLDFSSPNEWHFRGDVRFAGHSGMLFVKIADPRIRILGPEGNAELTVADPYGSDTRLQLVTLRVIPQGVRGRAQTWVGTDVRLSADGVELFNYVYQPGEEFDSLEIVVEIGPEA